MKNKGFSMVELIIAMCLFSITSFFIVSNYKEKLNKTKAYNEKIKIISAINKLQKKANFDENIYEINFNLDDNKIYCMEDLILLDKNFKYDSKNISNNFIRKTTENGNFDKGFSISIKNKDGKVYENIVYDTTNGLNVPVLNYEN